MAKTKKSIVFCHGIWADGSSFSKVIPALQAEGFEVIASQYGFDTLKGDVATVTRTLGRVSSPAILVGHSYGGSVITAAGADDRVAGFREAPRLPHWVNAGIYVLDEEALDRLPERGDHEQSTFPELAEEGKLFGFRHEGVWITVNTPKDLQRAEALYAARPELRPSLARNRP